MNYSYGVVFFIVGLGFTALSATAQAADSPKIVLKKGDRIVFLGDSITQAGVGPKGYVTLIKKALEEKHKDLGIEVIGAGISGNKIPDLQKRLEKDVLAKKPTVVVIYIGINDVWHREMKPPQGTPMDKFEEGLKDIIGRIQKNGAQVLLCTPSVIGEKTDGTNKQDGRLEIYAAISRCLGRELKLPLCDLRREFLEYLQSHNPEQKEKEILTTDGVHLNEAGNAFVAEIILKALGAS